MIKPDYNGKTFQNPGTPVVTSGLDALRWALTRRPAKWPRRLPNPPADPVSPRVMGSDLRVTFVNHATVLIQTQGQNLLTDPVFSRRASPVRFAGPARHRAPGIALTDLPPIDTVLISHCHYDHLDLRSLARLHEAFSPQVITPLKHAPLINKATGAAPIELDWWDEHGLADPVTVTLVPARHWSSRSLGDANRALWGGYVIGLPDGAVYFAGDTGYGDGAHFSAARDALGPFRLALLPIGAYEPRWFMKPQHMNPAEAVQAFVDLQARYALGIHFGTFRLTDEGHDAPVTDLNKAMRHDSALSTRFRAIENGQAWDVPALNATD